MRFVFLLAALSCWAQPADHKATVTGRILSSSTGAPLKNASVSLELFDPEGGVNEAPSVPAVATDAEGRFIVSGLDPGAYLLVAKHSGYLARAAAPFAAGAGVTKSLDLALSPQSLVYGKVLDEDGDPMPRAQVSVQRFAFIEGRRRLAEVRSATAQDDGSFIVGGLAPGRYYVRATPPKSGAPQGRERLVANSFPGPIDVPAGGDVRGVEIRIRKARVFQVRGRVVNTDAGGLAGNILIRCSPGDDWASVAADPTGAFVFDGLQPGTYTISTDPVLTDFVRFHPGEPPRSSPMLFGSTVFTVGNADLDGLVLPVARGAEITAVVRGGTAGIVLEGSDGRQIWSDGPRWGQLRPDRYLVHVATRADSYVKSMSFAGVPLQNAVLDLPSGASGELAIQLARDTGRVSGVTAPGAVVQLWPAAGGPARSVRADVRGAFRFEVLPPGDYRVLAWQFAGDDLDDDLADYAPFRARFEAEAVKIHLSGYGHEVVELTPLDAAWFSAQVAQLQ